MPYDLTDRLISELRLWFLIGCFSDFYWLVIVCLLTIWGILQSTSLSSCELLNLSRLSRIDGLLGNILSMRLCIVLCRSAGHECVGGCGLWRPLTSILRSPVLLFCSRFLHHVIRDRVVLYLRLRRHNGFLIFWTVLIMYGSMGSGRPSILSCQSFAPFKIIIPLRYYPLSIVVRRFQAMLPWRQPYYL